MLPVGTRVKRAKSWIFSTQDCDSKGQPGLGKVILNNLQEGRNKDYIYRITWDNEHTNVYKESDVQRADFIPGDVVLYFSVRYQITSPVQHDYVFDTYNYRVYNGDGEEHEKGSFSNGATFLFHEPLTPAPYKGITPEKIVLDDPYDDYEEEQYMDSYEEDDEDRAMRYGSYVVKGVRWGAKGTWALIKFSPLLTAAAVLVPWTRGPVLRAVATMLQWFAQ